MERGARMADDLFATTRWTMVFAAGKTRGEDSSGSEALEDLCRIYWFPLYAYVRRRGYGKEDAEDLTQMFFAKLLERPDFSQLHHGEGKFRAFLLASLKHFLANEWDKASALKRGGHLTRLSLDWSTADARYGLSDDGALAPDKAFDREWALALLERVVVMVKAEWVAGGKAEQFEDYKCFLTMGKGELAYSDIASRTGENEESLRVTAHRLRKRYRHLLREEIKRTLADDTVLDEEMTALLGAFS